MQRTDKSPATKRASGWSHHDGSESSLAPYGAAVQLGRQGLPTSGWANSAISIAIEKRSDISSQTLVSSLLLIKNRGQCGNTTIKLPPRHDSPQATLRKAWFKPATNSMPARHHNHHTQDGPLIRPGDDLALLPYIKLCTCEVDICRLSEAPATPEIIWHPATEGPSQAHSPGRRSHPSRSDRPGRSRRRLARRAPAAAPSESDEARRRCPSGPSRADTRGARRVRRFDIVTGT